MKTFSQPHLHIGKIEPVSEVNGPGRRFVIWAQGCNFGCPGCMNEWLQDFKSRKAPVLIPDVVELIADAQREHGIEGVTFTGGEPFIQARGFFHLALAVKRKLGLSIMAYSGYTKGELQNSKYAVRRGLVTLLDILIDGKFEKEMAAPLLWRGSSNQKVYFLTNRYRKEDFNDDHQEVEVFVDELTGKMEITGGMTFQTLQELEAELGVKA